MVREKISINTNNEREKLILKKKPQINNDILATKKKELETKINQMIKSQTNTRKMSLNELNETLTKIAVNTAERLTKKSSTNPYTFKILDETRKLIEKRKKLNANAQITLSSQS